MALVLFNKAPCCVVAASSRHHRNKPVAVVRVATMTEPATAAQRPPTAERVAPSAAASAASAAAAAQHREVAGAAPAASRLATPHNLHILCGRVSMMAMAVGAANEVATQQPLVAQLLHAAPTVAAAAAVITAASAFPLLMGEVEGDEVFGPFQPRAEALNGSLAIAGLAAALALEALRGGAPLL